jgi:8-oxo-dGTP pyrophosphatase MutT (NUDIX family)
MNIMVKRRIVEVTNKEGKLTGQLADVEEARKAGLWYRAVHVVVYTPDGQILVQKRGATNHSSLRYLDISVGAVVPSNETPSETIMQRMKEELGLIVEPETLQDIGQSKHEYTESLNGKVTKDTKTILVDYLVQLPSPNVVLKYLKSDVSWAGFLSLKQVKRLVEDGELEALGILQPRQEYYRKFITEIEQRLST